MACIMYTKEEFEKTMSTLRVRFPNMNFDTIDPRFMHPFTAIIAGPSQSGVSVLHASNKQCPRVYCSSTRTYSVLLQRIPTFYSTNIPT